MPLTALSVPTFPTVPNTPGVPQVLRAAGQVLSTVSLVTADVSAFLGLFGAGAQWGLFDDDGNQPIEADSVKGYDHRKEYRVASFPIEDGGFGSYNKVETPFEGRLTYIKSGNPDDQAQFLDQVAAVVDGLDLYTVMTPQASYDNCNATHYDYRRQVQNGATLLTVDVWVEEIRTVDADQVTTTPATAPQDASGAPTKSGGTVQATPALPVPPVPPAQFGPPAPMPAAPPGATVIGPVLNV